MIWVVITLLVIVSLQLRNTLKQRDQLFAVVAALPPFIAAVAPHLDEDAARAVSPHLHAIRDLLKEATK